MTRSRRFFASSLWIATGTPDYVNLGYTSRGLAKQALMRLSRKSLAIFRKLGLGRHGYTDDYENHFQAATIRSRGPVHSKFSRLPAYSISALISAPMRHASPVT